MLSPILLTKFVITKISQISGFLLISSLRQLYVTTLDGRLSTIDLTEGLIQWSIRTEPGDLISSSIHRLELTNNGKYVRMIPSLSGGIYKFDGDSIEAIPVTAEDLLKSSFKYTDEMVISGGKELRSYGINSRTGRIIYECSLNGCKSQNLTDSAEEPSESQPDEMLDDILVVRRQTQTVRAIEPRSGSERWNFSIGHHELEMLPNDNCQSQGSKNDEIESHILDFELRVIIPDGLVCAYSKKSPNEILWQQKFDAPIVSIYRMDSNNKLYSVDLFNNVKWLWEDKDFFKPSVDSKLSPSVYLGMFQQQLYIQESNNMKATLEHHKQLDHNLITDEAQLPKIPFKPYPATRLIEGSALPPSNNGQSQDLINIDVELNAQSVLYASQYADGNGVFLYTESDYNNSIQCGKKTRSTKVSVEEFDNITFNNHGILGRSSSLWDYWKEISVIALTTAIVINIMLNNRKRQGAEVVYVTVPFGKEAIDYDEEHQNRIEEELFQAKVRSQSESNTKEAHYISRFLTDFDLVQCLGKGGFGVVFEVKNKLDDCHYAIKRILLPSKKESRERVMREVKTLANCEHKNIVRYFHAWVEQPPKGWQEQEDKNLLTRDICSTSITIDSPSPTQESKAFTVHNEKSEFSVFKINTNNFTNNRFDDTSSFIQFQAASQDISNEQSENVDEEDESFEIEFKEPTQDLILESQNEESHVVSFQTSDKDSLSISGTHPRSKKKSHKRQLSLDLTSLTESKLKKTNLASNGSPCKMYLYIQMQLCMKNSLKDWLRENDLQMRTGKKIYEIWNQIIEAVHYVHLKGLIHRDLKPGNIFFSLDQEVKIGDFGLVAEGNWGAIERVGDTDQIVSSSSNSSASVGALDFSQKKHTQRVGTSLYMSPEQSNGLNYNYKVDIFSLGLILFELLSFFKTESERYRVLLDIRKDVFPSEFIEKNKQEVRREMRLRRSYLTLEFFQYELLQLMLSKRPEERPTTFGILSRPPLNKSDKSDDRWQFELPSRRLDSQSSHSSLEKQLI